VCDALDFPLAIPESSFSPNLTNGLAIPRTVKSTAKSRPKLAIESINESIVSNNVVNDSDVPIGDWDLDETEPLVNMDAMAEEIDEIVEECEDL
jgi:hypothetical protein